MEGINNNHTYQILLRGDASVGKTQMVQRFTHGKVSENKISTVGNESVTVDVVLKNGVHVKVQIWDTDERLKELTQTCSQGTVGVLLVYDVTRLDTFGPFENWLKEAKKYTEEKKVSFAVVGNKTDTIPQIYIDMLNVVYFAERNNIQAYNCSALKGDNIDAIFKALVEEMYSKTEKNQRASH